MKRLLLSFLFFACLTAALAADRVEYGWGSTDVRYSEAAQFPRGRQVIPKPLLVAWRGERVSAQFVVLNNSADSALVSFSPSLLLDADIVSGGWVESVLADSYCGCGGHEIDEFGNRLMPDRISHNQSKILTPGSLSAAWLTVRVPENAAPGIYDGSLTLIINEEQHSLPYQLRVVDRVLPPPSQWSFHLDFWQNPYAVARYHSVEPWSPEHFSLMRPLMTELASAGQKVVTATLTARPWNSQTQDPFGSMVTWIRRADGSWLYDFTVFDLWVEFMDSCGINSQINCYSMLPWRMSFEYFDQATSSLREIHCQPGEPAYDNFWGGMLSEFASHLRSKGWLQKTFIAMDERSPEQMSQAMSLIKKVAPELKISLAGDYHPAIEAQIDDYCIAFSNIAEPSAEVLSQRRERGQITTFYTSCSTDIPNTFTFSSPIEAELLPWLSAAHGLDGYLRWAYNSWTADPLTDSRFRTWPSGDCYIVYPSGETSIRWERLVEGVQQYEKWRLLGSDPSIVSPLLQLLPMPEMSRRLHRARKALNQR